MSDRRKDAWTNEDDLILARIVLQHIKSGITQLEAFHTVGERLGRSAAACGFRWNSTVRKQCEQQVEEAKVYKRQSTNKKLRSELRNEKAKISFSPNDKFMENKWLKEQLHLKEKEIASLKQEIAQMRKYPTEFTITEDYKALLNILENARKLGISFNDQQEAVKFKMDQNGNLEKIG